MDAKDVRKLREEALAGHDGRAAEIDKWSKDHGGAHHRVNRYASKVNPQALNALCDYIQGVLERVVLPDSLALLEILNYLRHYNFTETDEAGRDSSEFSLAVSEIEVALGHFQRDTAAALRYLVYRHSVKKNNRNYQVRAFPTFLYVEAALACNLMCTMCYQSDPKMQAMIKDSEKTMMDWDLYTKIIDEAASHGLCGIIFAGRGEPTLNRRFTDMIKYAWDKGILDIKFNTNVMKLTEKMVCDWLSMNAPLTVVFSVDAADKEGFEAIRLGASFEKVVANIEMFNRIRKEEFPDTPVRTRVSMTLFQDNQDPEAARKLWGSLVDEFTAKNARGEQSGSIYQNDLSGSPKNISPDVKCRVLFDRLYVWCDGKVNPCEDDYMSKLVVGNAYQSSLKDLWQGPAMMKMRLAHLNGKKNSCYPCNGCNGY